MNEKLENEIIVSLVQSLPDNTTLTLKQVSECAPIIARIVEREQGGMDTSSFNAYEQIRDEIKEKYPNAFLRASRKCSEDNCQSMATILCLTIDILACNNDIEKLDDN